MYSLRHESWLKGEKWQLHNWMELDWIKVHLKKNCYSFGTRLLVNTIQWTSSEKKVITFLLHLIKDCEDKSLFPPLEQMN